MEHLNGLLDVLNESLGKTASSRVVMGAPIELGAVTLVPVSRVGFGCGGGGGEGEGTPPGHHGKKKVHCHGPGKGIGGGAGAGVKARPVALIVFKPAGVEILPIPDRKGSIERLVEKLPDWVERFADKLPKKDS